MRNLQLATAFSHAIPYLAPPSDPFGHEAHKHGGSCHTICMAIKEAQIAGDISWATCKLAQELVRERLGEDVGYVSTWLAKRGHISTSQSWGEMVLVQEYRQRWLVALAAEFRGQS